MFYTIDDIAQVCHEANRVLQALNGDPVNPPWEQLDADLRSSTASGVQYALDNPLANPVDQHEAWMRERVEQGWVFGPVKNTETREHPQLVPYDELPEAQRAKDKVFTAIVRALS